MSKDIIVAITLTIILVINTMLYVAYLAGVDSVISHCISYEVYKEYDVEMQCKLIKEQ